jgi:hypothetical protein
MDDAWLAEHKGPLRRITGEVWYCGDDWCGCSQAQIVEHYANLKPPPGAPNAVVLIATWQGTFYSDHEPGAESELAAKRVQLRATDPALEARIEWR